MHLVSVEENKSNNNNNHLIPELKEPCGAFGKTLKGKSQAGLPENSG